MAWKPMAGADFPSVWLRAGELTHLDPLFGFIREELCEVSGRAGQRRAAEIGNQCLHLGVGKGGVEFLIEPLDNVGGRAGRCGDAIPRARLIAWEEIGHGWKLG